MTDHLNYKNRRFDDVDRRSKGDLLDELALSKDGADQRIAHLLSELHARQAELEMQNQELRKVQQTLEETRDRYAALYDFSPVGYLTLDSSGRIVEINLTGAVMLGMERANLVGKAFSTRLEQGDVHAFFHHLHDARNFSGNTVTELRIVSRDGGINYIRLESAPIKDGAHLYRTVMTDITEQRRVAEALQQARAEQDVLLNAVPAFVFYKDVNLRYVAVSQMLADFLGRRTFDVIGKTDLELFPHEVAENFQRMSRDVLAEGRIRFGLESRLTDAAGNTLYLSLVLAPFFNPPGRIAGVLGVGLDISQIKAVANLNRDLMLENRKLLQNLFTIQEEQYRHLARELHDELGQWITAISADAHAIDSMAGKEHKIAASAQAIRDSAGKMHTVIRNLMRQLRPELLDELGLADSLHELVNQWQAHYPDIVCDLLLDGDFSGLDENTNITVYRIIQEALSNIARHAHATRVLVHLCRETGESADNEFMLITVEDNGQGIDYDQAQGFGVLGMRERAIAAGGNFSILNTPGKGVRIDVRLPVNCRRERGNDERG